MEDLQKHLKEEISNPFPMLDNVNPVTNYVTNDIGGEEKYQRGYPYKIYHFDVDEKFSTSHVKFGSYLLEKHLV